MIEVEKKFRLNDEQKTKLIDGAKFLKKVINNDEYFDTVDYKLSTKNNWLRMRDSKWELKISLIKVGDKNETGVDRFKELDDEAEIANQLGIKIDNSLVASLKTNGYKSFAKYQTVRRKYEKDGFLIDMDETDFGHNIVEIELLVDNESQIIEAKNNIVDFAKRHELPLDNILGKGLQYAKLNNSKLFKAMEEAGVIGDRK